MILHGLPVEYKLNFIGLLTFCVTVDNVTVLPYTHGNTVDTTVGTYHDKQQQMRSVRLLAG